MSKRPKDGKGVWDEEEFNKEQKKSWINKAEFEEALKDISPIMPVVTAYKKGEQTVVRSVTVSSTLYRRLEEVRDSNSKQFKTMSDVLRAALHIGGPILWKTKVEMKGEYSPKQKQIFELMIKFDKKHDECCLVDKITDEISSLHILMSKGTLSLEQRNDLINELLDATPNSIKDVVVGKIGTITNDTPKNIFHMYETAKSKNPKY